MVSPDHIYQGNACILPVNGISFLKTVAYPCAEWWQCREFIFIPKKLPLRAGAVRCTEKNITQVWTSCSCFWYLISQVTACWCKSSRLAQTSTWAMSSSSRQGNTDIISQDTSVNSSTSWQFKISHNYLQFLARSSCDSPILLNTVISQHKQQQRATNTQEGSWPRCCLLGCEQCLKSQCAQKTRAHCSHTTGGNHVRVSTYRSGWGQYHSIPQQQHHLPTQLLPRRGSYFFFMQSFVFQIQVYLAPWFQYSNGKGTGDGRTVGAPRPHQHNWC